MSPDRPAARWLEGVRRRLRAAGLADAVTAGSAAGAAVLVVSAAVGAEPRTSAAASGAAGVVVSAAVAVAAWRRWSPARAALAADRAAGLDNLLVTAEEIARGGTTAHPRLVDAVWQALDERVPRAPGARVAPLAAPLLRAAASVAVVAALAWSAGGQPGVGRRVLPPVAAATPVGIESVDVVVTPPAYTGRPPEAASDPAVVRALAGSRIRIDVRASAAAVSVTTAGGTAVPMVEGEAGRFHAELAAGQPMAVVLRPSAPDGRAGQERLLTIGVDSDGPPTVRIVSPGRDLRVPTPETVVEVAIEASDDIGLRELALGYTRVSGSGEAFSFVEGSVPVAIVGRDAGVWRGRARLDLQAMGLGDGDAVAYRARARDGNPAGAPAVSASFLVEVGREGGASSDGFALPKDEERQGLSQQMLILHTEALHAKRAGLDAETWAEETRRLAVEQRMVKAEFVFMTGGEVEDEVAEAESSSELAEGRLENSSQVELLTAIRAMSRAEAALNGGDTTSALVFERQGLDALQRAFAKRRYFLRTLPERSRIDMGRRLSGELDAATSWRREASAAGGGELGDLAALASALGDALARSGPPDAGLAARVAAYDPAWADLQAAARGMVNGATPEDRRQALADAVRLLSARALARLAPAPGGGLPGDPLAGRLADERARRRGAPR
ncbi:MAG: DUF4175 family protein [Vicinamibacterales bacterium]